jgi:DNA polymerase delta subunit 2
MLVAAANAASGSALFYFSLALLQYSPLQIAVAMTLSTNTATPPLKPVNRAFAVYTPLWQKFQTDVTLESLKISETGSSSQLHHPYQRQYSHVYAQRLAQLKPRCLDSIPNDDDNIAAVSRILDLREGIPCRVVGTLVKECSMNHTDEPPLYPNRKTCGASDVLYLEDESGRVTLECSEDNKKHEWTTGMVVAVEGVVHHGGVFHVDTFFTPSVAPHMTFATTTTTSTEQRDKSDTTTPHVLLLSGLNCAAPGVCSLARDMLLGYLEGSLIPAQSGAQEESVCRVVIAGNSAAPSTDAVQELDAWIAQLCAAGIPITLLPGQEDASTANWPQRPLHSSLFKYGGSFVDSSLLSRTPNPMACGINDKYVIGTDGRNVADLYQHTNVSTELEAMALLLKCGHVCPTGPSSVPTVPSGEVDVMVMEHTPHLLFAGNCSQFATDLVTRGSTKTRMVCIPKFSETGQAILVNMETLNVQVLEFDDGMEQ